MVAKTFQGSRSKAFLVCSSGPALPRMRSFATVCVPECYFPVTRSKYMHRTSELSTSMLDFLVGDIHAERIHCFCFPHTHSRTSKEGRSLFARDGKVKPQRSINVSLNLDLVCKAKRQDGTGLANRSPDFFSAASTSRKVSKCQARRAERSMHL